MLNPFYGQVGKHPKKELKGTSKIVFKTMLQLRLPIFQSDMLAFDPLQRILQNLWDLVPSRIRGPKTNFYGIIWLGLGPLYFENFSSHNFFTLEPSPCAGDPKNSII